MQDTAGNLYSTYHLFKENSLNNRRIKHASILPLIELLKNNNNFRVKEAGKSVEGRSIYLISTGKGKKKIFLWSQMHGDESTATMALFDIFNFFNDKESFKELKEEILRKATLYFMPMVNPDGAEAFKRRNAYDIDLNRDARGLQSPESKILFDTFDSLKADFGFNLHDQHPYYTAGNTHRCAALSFLAPPVDYGKTIPEQRARAMQLISQLNVMLKDFIPGHTSRYKDDYEPRAFGDCFQRSGTSTILIESGWWNNDEEKQFIRKMNFVTLISAFQFIADESYRNYTPGMYEDIPFSQESLFDLILRQVEITDGGNTYKTDIAINYTEDFYKNNSRYYYSEVMDIGDLSSLYGKCEYDLSGLSLFPGITYPKVFKRLEDIDRAGLQALHSKGYINLKLKESVNKKYTNFPFNIYLSSPGKKGFKLELGLIPNFIFKHKKKIEYVMVNGFLINPFSGTSDFKNGLIFR